MNKKADDVSNTSARKAGPSFLDEYKEIGINWRYWGEVRFKQLTAYLSATAVLGAAVMSEKSVGLAGDLRPAFAILGLAITLAFLVLEERATYNRHAYMSCALALETSETQLSEYRRTKNPWPLASDTVYRFLFSSVATVWLWFLFGPMAPNSETWALGCGATLLIAMSVIGRRFLDLAARAGTSDLTLPTLSTLQVVPKNVANEVDVS